MSANKHKPHVLVLPEDDANRQIANGFFLRIAGRAWQVLPPAGGWARVIEEFERDHVFTMRQYPDRNIVLVMDFDHQVTERLERVKAVTPPELHDRVFVLGVLSEPEELKAKLKMTFEAIGESLFQDCADDTRRLWSHELLKHSATEIDRLVSSVRPFLFSRSVRNDLDTYSIL